MSQSVLITASILSADLTHLQEEVETVEPYADWLQIDVMDGQFVPNLSFGAPLIKDLKTKLPLDIHLMVEDPANRIDEFVKVGAKNITFHAEAVPDSSEQKKLIEMIRSTGCTAGIAINPETSVDAIKEVISDVDLVLCMTVHPGFSGQTFEQSVLPKIEEVRKLAPDVMIQVDGGINAETGKRCRKAGATNLVAASAVFGSKDRKKAIEALRE